MSIARESHVHEGNLSRPYESAKGFSAAFTGETKGKALVKTSTTYSRIVDMALKLTMTCGPYDRARALIDGTVKPEGIDLEVHVNQRSGPAYQNRWQGVRYRRVLHRHIHRRSAVQIPRLYGDTHFRQTDVPPFLYLYK